MDFHHIINGCSVNLRLLTDREIHQLIWGNQLRRAVLNGEHDLLVQEEIRRSDLPEWRHVPDPPALF